MNKYLIFIILFLFLIQNVNADILPFGKKYADDCFIISNMNDYHDYIFIEGNEFLGQKIINPDECFSVYKLGTSIIYAIKKIDFDANILKKNYNEKDAYKVYNEREAYFKDVLKSNIKLGSYPLPNSNDPLNKVVTFIDIKELNENNFVIEQSKIVFTYEDGTSEEKNFISQDVRPEPSRKAILPWWFAEFWFVILPLLALIIIISVLIKNKLRK